MARGQNDDAICPFFISADKQHITCEGLVDKSYLSQFFRKTSDKKICKETFCDAKYKNCEIYQMLVRNYDEEE